VSSKSVAPSRPDLHPASATGSGSLSAEPTTDQPFTGELTPLHRVATVQPDTVAVLISASKPLQLRHPGDTLIPSWRPFRAALRVLPVNVAKIPLRAVINSVTTFDGYPVDQVTLRVWVQLAEAGGHTAVLDLVDQHGPGFGSYLMDQLQSTIETCVRGAFRLNNLADLRRRLVGILEERWLPPSFAGGALLRRGLALSEVTWPLAESANRARIGRTAESESTISAFELSMEARLRRMWAAGSPVDVAGIAGAAIGEAAAVIAACDPAPETAQLGQLRESFAELYNNPNLVLAVTGTRDFADVVRGWLQAVASRKTTLLGVDVVRGADTLRIHLSHPLVSTDAAVEALRRLLPHRRIEFQSLAER
jgi:hypothetical protein